MPNELQDCAARCQCCRPESAGRPVAGHNHEPNRRCARPDAVAERTRIDVLLGQLSTLANAEGLGIWMHASLCIHDGVFVGVVHRSEIEKRSHERRLARERTARQHDDLVLPGDCSRVNEHMTRCGLRHVQLQTLADQLKQMRSAYAGIGGVQDVVLRSEAAAMPQSACASARRPHGEQCSAVCDWSRAGWRNADEVGESSLAVGSQLEADTVGPQRDSARNALRRQRPNRRVRATCVFRVTVDGRTVVQELLTVEGRATGIRDGAKTLSTPRSAGGMQQDRYKTGPAGTSHGSPNGIRIRVFTLRG